MFCLYFRNCKPSENEKNFQLIAKLAIPLVTLKKYITDKLRYWKNEFYFIFFLP